MKGEAGRGVHNWSTKMRKRRRRRGRRRKRSACLFCGSVGGL